MPRLAKSAEVVWDGSLSRGGGVASAGTGAFELPVDLPGRIGETGKTSPEELLAAAHAGCYAMSLAGEIASAGGTVERLAIGCTVTIDEVPGKGHLVVLSELDVRAKLAGLEGDGFQSVVRRADEGCTFSALLRASAEVSVQATLED